MSAYTSSAFLRSCPVQSSVYTAIITRLFKCAMWNTKWSRRTMESSLMCLFSERTESSVSPCLLHTGSINHNVDKCTFLSSLWAFNAFVWLQGLFLFCQMQLQTANLVKNKQSTMEVVTHSFKSLCCIYRYLPYSVVNVCLLCWIICRTFSWIHKDWAAKCQHVCDSGSWMEWARKIPLQGFSPPHGGILQIL